MPRIGLRVYINLGQIEAICNVQRTNGEYERLTAIVDTGAVISLFPLDLLARVSHRVETIEQVIIQQAGIAEQMFEATQCIITVTLEDVEGNKTEPFEILAWFADTQTALLGFEGRLDRAVLHVDMTQLYGYLDIDL